MLPLVLSSDAEIQRRGRGERGPIGNQLTGAPAPIEEESLLRIVHRENGLAPRVRLLIEPASDVLIAGPMPEGAQRRNRALGMVKESVEIDGDQTDRLERA